MNNFLHLTRQRLSSAWMAVQVELQGSYSVQRLRALESYINCLSFKRLVALCLLTPLPCLVLSLLKEVPPLKSIEDGASANWVFFIRVTIVAAVINGTLLIQMGHGASSLKLTAGQVIFIALSAAVVAVAIVFALCCAIIFPLPFGVLVSALPDVLVMAVCLVPIFGPRLRADPSVLTDLKQQLSVINCQVSLTFIYPVYIYGFVSVTGINQTLFVAILPIIKLIAKNWVSRALTGHDDIKPQSVIFIVEVFNALYVSTALQSASSWMLTASIMAVDIVHFCLSMFDVIEILNKVKVLLAKIPQDHPFAQENFLRIAIRILDSNDTLNDERQLRNDGGLQETPTERFTSLDDSRANLKTRDTLSPVEPSHKHKNGYMKKGSQGTRVLPVQANTSANDNSDIELFFSESERGQFIEKCTHVLFITEYIILVEYVEVVLPIVYSLYRGILFNMPNRDYFASLATLSEADLVNSILNVLVYSSFELISLVVSIGVLKRTLGFSSLSQLAFVLETHIGLVQVALINILVYVTQLSLVHLGADFSFKFSWLHTSP